jgi:glycosyltransferase involved in cell wall biosynthesis
MKILWFTWKDKTHPLAGGAEVINEELAKRFVKDGHEVVLIVGGYKGAVKEEVIDGYKVVRLGNKFTIYLEAFLYYRKFLRGWADCIIEEINTMPFMTQWYAKEKKVLLFYQLCREIWFYQMIFPLNVFGYLIEPVYLWLLRKNHVLTESESTKKDLQKYGFDPTKINIFPVGINTQPLEGLDIDKYKIFTVLSLGAVREMKRTVDQLKAFEILKSKKLSVQMKIVGDTSGSYGKKLLELINKSPYKDSIEYLGKVPHKIKQDVMQKSHLILVTSVKEGWGLIVTEAASQGTPAVVYDVDGLRDSVIDKKTGLVAKHTPADLAEKIITLYQDKSYYNEVRKNAWSWAKGFSFDKSYQIVQSLISK